MSPQIIAMTNKVFSFECFFNAIVYNYISMLAMIIILIVLLVLLFVFLFELSSVTGAPYVPTRDIDLEKAFTKVYRLSSKDLVVDFGSGNGKILSAASSFGAKAIGLEINPVLALYSRFKLRHNDSVKVFCKSMYSFDLPRETTLVYLYGNTLVIRRIYRRLESEATRLNKSIFLLTNAFDQKGVKPKKYDTPYYLYEIKP